MDIKYYSLSTPIKQKLGRIISIIRQNNYREFKKDHLVEVNPYTKENFCENNKICHYHTLTKLETDFIRDDNIYHVLLYKLNLLYQIKDDIHESTMNELNKFLYRIMDAIEINDENEKNLIINEIKQLNYSNDCIASLYLELLLFFINVYHSISQDINIIQRLENFIDIYDGLFKAVAYQAVGYGYYLNGNYQKGELYCKNAINIYNVHNISIGLSHFPLIEIYLKNNNYFEAVQICNILEEYYVKSSNKKRLLSIYIYLVEYYLLINSKEFAKKYFDEAIFLATDEDSYHKCMLYYKWGHYEFTNYTEQEALRYFELAYSYCQNQEMKLMIINRILMCLSLLNSSKELIYDYLNKGYPVIDKSIDLERVIFNYFVNKMLKDNDYEDLCVKNLIPILKKRLDYKIVLLFFYRDLYK